MIKRQVKRAVWFVFLVTCVWMIRIGNSIVITGIRWLCANGFEEVAMLATEEVTGFEVEKTQCPKFKQPRTCIIDKMKCCSHAEWN